MYEVSRADGEFGEKGTSLMTMSRRETSRRTDRRPPTLATREQRIVDQVPFAAGLSSFQPVSDVLALAATVSVIIPALNEAPNLPHVFEALPDWITEVVLVDGRSTDDTVAVARRLRPDVRVVMQDGRGKGDALLAGFTASTGDIIVALDADGSTDAREIVRFVTALVAGADFVKGSRFACGGGSADLTRTRRLGNKLLGALVNQLFGTRYTDLCYGYNAFWARHLNTLALDCAGFEVETVMNIRAAAAGLVVHEVPSFEHRRIHGVSNLRIVVDGRRIAKVIIREWLTYRRSKRARIQVPPAIGASAIDRSASDLSPSELSASDLSFSDLRAR
jgi:glycosyltransferase involved in cell wall biosynthesis